MINVAMKGDLGMSSPASIAISHLSRKSSTVVSAFCIVLLWISTLTECLSDDAIEFHVVANRVKGPGHHIVKAAEGIAAFGRKVEPASLRIDSESRSIADVLVWTERSDEERSSATTATRRLVLANANYWPHVLIARKGDKLEFVNTELVADAHNLRDFFDYASSGRNMFTLSRNTDRPIQIRSTLYVWIESTVFVADRFECARTDRLGTCRIGASNLKKSSVVFIWHSLTGPVAISKCSDNVKYLRRGQVSIASHVESRAVDIEIDIDAKSVDFE